MISKGPKSSRLSDEERARKLEEMMGNAKWRDEQRTINVRHYREQDKVQVLILLIFTLKELILKLIKSKTKKKK